VNTKPGKKFMKFLSVVRKSVAVFLNVFILTANASEIPTSGSFLPSLDWQKVGLEKAIGEKVRTALSRIIKSNEYLVDVEINVNQATKPKFTPQDGEDGAGDEGAEDNKGKVKIKDILPDQLPKDYIVFSKLGLEAPLIEDFNDFKDEKGKPLADKKKEPLPPFEQLWKYNKSLDIFNNLESVKIYIQLSEQLHPTTRENIKKMLNALKFNLNDVTPELEITYINMQEKKSGLDLPSSVGEILALISRFSNMFGLIMAAIVIGLIAFMLFNKWAKLDKDKNDAQNQALAGPAPKEDEEEEDDKAAAGLPPGPFDQENTSAIAGVERYQTFLDNSPVEAVMLVKKWVASGESKEKNALRALVQQLKNDTLLKIFAKLTQEERDLWKSFLDKQVIGNDLLETNAFISNQIVEDILVPSAIVDAEACDTLMRINPERAAQFVKENPDLGKILMNVMSSKFIAKILENLDEEYVELAIARGMEYRREDVGQMLSEFKSKLAKYKEQKTRIPFLEKILDLIPISMPARENSLFKALAQSGEDADTLKKIALQNFPAVLVPVLPDKILKSALQQYPMGQKIELVSTLKEDMRDKFITLFAPKGSKASDMLTLELEKIENDLAIQRKIRETPDVVWKEFVDYTRKIIRNDKINSSDYDNMVTQWADKIIGGESPEMAAQAVDPEKTATNRSVKAAA